MSGSHDSFRGSAGSLHRSVEAIRALKAAGLRTGMRFTVSQQNFDELDQVLRLAEREGVPRFSLFQLVYAGRGRDLLDWDIEQEQRRQLIRYCIERTRDFLDRGVELEIVTADNYCDGIFIYNHVLETMPERAAEVYRLLELQSGCTAGEKLVNVDHRGDVHPCPYWQYLTLGNVRERALSGIWFDAGSAFLSKMRAKEKYLTGKCGRCGYRHLCGGCRVRADVVHGDPLTEDPACYLTEKEIAVDLGNGNSAPGSPRTGGDEPGEAA